MHTQIYIISAQTLMPRPFFQAICLRYFTNQIP